MLNLTIVLKLMKNQLKKIINKKTRRVFISEILFNLDNGEKLENKYNIIKKIIDEKVLVKQLFYIVLLTLQIMVEK